MAPFCSVWGVSTSHQPQLLVCCVSSFDSRRKDCHTRAPRNYTGIICYTNTEREAFGFETGKYLSSIQENSIAVQIGQTST